MMWFGGLMMFVVWIPIVLLVVWGVRAFSPTQRRDEPETALAVLQRRYAAGEIDEAEYERVQRVLGGAEAAPLQPGSK